MRYSLAAGAIIAASISGVSAGAFEEAGNWYNEAVQKIQYSGLGVKGSYQKVTQMYPTCQQSSQSYSGALAPFDEEVSIHCRGPMVLKQVAVYTPSSSSKTKARRAPHDRRHGHAGFHKRNKEIREIQERAEEEEKRAIGDMVTVTMNGQVVSWTNMYGGPGGPATAAPSSTAAATPASSHKGAGGYIANAASSAKAAIESAFTPSKPAAAGDWERIAYYDADSSTAEGLTFLNNMGGSASGVFDNKYGNSLAYASSDSNSAAASPQVSNGTLASNKEFIIFSDKKCSGDSCGYYRDGSVAYHAFDGAEKAFYFEFSMPDDGTSGWNMNMPSLWLLNAQIPRTGQYSDCCCWKTGCGEFDICEVLDSGNKKCKSTWHGNIAGGSSDYFNRPTSGTMKMAVVMANSQINVQVLDDSTEFGSSMSKSSINDVASDNDSSKILSTLFKLGS